MKWFRNLCLRFVDSIIAESCEAKVKSEVDRLLSREEDHAIQRREQVRRQCEHAATEVRNRLGVILAEQDQIRRRNDEKSVAALQQEIQYKINSPEWLRRKLNELEK